MTILPTTFPASTHANGARSGDCHKEKRSEWISAEKNAIMKVQANTHSVSSLQSSRNRDISLLFGSPVSLALRLMRYAYRCYEYVNCKCVFEWPIRRKSALRCVHRRRRRRPHSDVRRCARRVCLYMDRTHANAR